MTPEEWARRWNELIDDGTIDQLVLFDDAEAKRKTISLISDELYAPNRLMGYLDRQRGRRGRR